MKVKSQRLKVCICVLIGLLQFLNSGYCFAAGDITVHAEYEAVAGELKTVAESMALATAMQDAVGQIETLVNSESKKMGGVLSKDVVYAVASGIIQVDDKKVEWLNDKTVRVTIHTSIKETDINAYRQKYLSDDKIILQYKKMRDEYSLLQDENNRLKSQLVLVTDRNKIDLIKKEIRDKNQHYLAAIWFEKAYSQHVLGQDNDAFTYLDTALSFMPDFSNAYGLYGNIYDDEGKLDLALLSYKKALEIEPNYTEVICDEGLVYKQKHDLAMAMQCYNTALKIDPYLGPAYNLRADIYNLYNQPKNAIVDYQSALKINYMDYTALVGMSMSLRELQQYSTAIEYANRAISVNPKGADGYMAKAMSLAFVGRLRETVDYLNQAIQYSINKKLREQLVDLRNLVQQSIRTKEYPSR